MLKKLKELMLKRKEEKELQAEQKMEGIQASEECGTKGDRSDNKKETVQTKICTVFFLLLYKAF